MFNTNIPMLILMLQIFNIKLLYHIHTKKLKDENMVKTVRGTKVKVFFQGLQMTHVFVLICNFEICILGTPLTLHFR
jgi:hypothetical protein